MDMMKPGFLVCLFGIALLAPIGCSEQAGQSDFISPLAEATVEKAAGLPGVDTIAVESDPLAPATFVVAWSVPETQPLPPISILHYRVAINYVAGINKSNWSTTTLVLETVPAGDKNFARVYDTSNVNVVAGANAWITVVPCYTTGVYGMIMRNVVHRITDGFVISGVVISDRFVPLDGVMVEIPAHGLTTETESGGTFQFGPLSDEGSFVLRTNTPDELPPVPPVGSWFDFTTTPIGVDNSQVTICLIDRTDLQDYFGTNYIVCLGSYTKWFHAEWSVRWDHYPCSVYIPDGWNQAGTIDLGSLVRQQMAHMNELIGRDTWVEIADSTQADIRFSYEVLPNDNGATWLNPHLPFNFRRWGYVAPELIRVAIDPGLSNEAHVAGVMNHELGHSLYFGGHSLRGLMMNGGYGEPTADDLRLFRSVMAIPIGTPFHNYEWYDPTPQKPDGAWGKPLSISR